MAHRHAQRPLKHRLPGMGSKAWLAAAVGCAWDSVLTMRLSGVVVTWNDAAVRLFGYQPAEMIGRSFMRIVPPELRGEEAQILSRVAHGERISHYETARLRKDGTRVDVSVVYAPVRDSAGTIVGASTIAYGLRPF